MSLPPGPLQAAVDRSLAAARQGGQAAAARQLGARGWHAPAKKAQPARDEKAQPAVDLCDSSDSEVEVLDASSVLREAAARAGNAEARAAGLEARADTEREARAGAEARAKGMEAERDAAREAAAKLRGQLGRIAARAAEASAEALGEERAASAAALEAAGRREAELEAALGRKAAGDGTCVVCMENARAVVFRPCRHLSCCAECAAGLTECPHCRTPIEDRENIFNL
jgi:hypothetical protein